MKGECNSRAILTERQVLEIRAIYGAAAKASSRVPSGTLTDLARRYGIGLHALKDIVYLRNWNHI